jgi:lipoprotein-releasing system permease protein
MFYLALKQMLSRKKQTFLIFLGISFGTMIYVIIAGIQYGMRDYIAEQLLNNTAHIIISGNERFIDKDALTPRFYDHHELVNWINPPYGKRDEAKLENPQGWFTRLKNNPRVKAYAPRLSSNAIMTKGNNKTSVSLIGIIPSRQVQVTSMEDYMKKGSLLNIKVGGNKIVVASEILKKLGARVGQSVFLSIGIGVSRPFKIVGKLHLGNKQLDEQLVYTHLNDLQAFNHTPGRISEISVSLYDMDLATEEAQNLSIYTQDKVQGWKEANASFMQLINIQDAMRIVISAAILLVAGFGIYNILSIMIGQKQKEIAILRSIGYRPFEILKLFLFQGLTLGFFGGLIGLIIGHLCNMGIGNIDLGFDIGKGSNLLISYRPSIYITAFLAAQGAALIASIFPAKKAASLTPMEIIRANI